MGFVQRDQHRDLGVVGRGNAHKAGNARLGVLRVQLLAGAGLAAHPVARHIGVLAAAAVHHPLHQFAHGGAGLRADDLPLHGGLHLAHHPPVRVGDLFHDIGLHQLSPVHNGGHGGDHLNGGDLAGLAKSAACQLHRAHAVRGVKLALFGFCGQIDARGALQPKGREVVAEPVLAQPLPDLDKALVAAVGQRLRHRLAAVAPVVGAVKRDARHQVSPAAVERAGRGHRACVQRGRTGNQLKHRARLVQIAHGLVAPLGLLGQLQSRLALLALQRVHLGAHIRVRNHPGLVGVIVRLCCDRQNPAGVHLHHNPNGPGRHIVLLHRIVQVFFQVVLHAGFNRELQAVALHRRNVGVIVCGHIVAPGVLGAQHPPVRAL